MIALQTAVPGPVLREFVRIYAEREVRSVEQGVSCLAEAIPSRLEQTVEFQWGVPFTVLHCEGYKLITPNQAVIGAQTRGCSHIELLPGVRSFGVFFKPTGLSCLLRLPVCELTNRNFDAALIFKQVREIAERLAGCRSFDQRVCAIGDSASCYVVDHRKTPVLPYYSGCPAAITLAGEQERIVAEIEKQFTRLDAATAALKRVQANLKRYRALVLKAACEGRLVPTEAELARKEGLDYEPAGKLLERILRERRERWEANTLAKMIASGKSPKDETWKRKYKEPAAPDTTDLPPLPEGWCWATLDEIALLQGGITKGQKRKNDVLRAVPYLRVANVQRGFLNLSQVSQIEATEAEINELRLEPGDVLFNEGGDRDKLGRGWIWEGQLPECIHQNHVFRARMVLVEVDPRFISFYSNEFGQQYFFDQGKHTTNLASLSMSKLRELPVPLPPASEQKRIIQSLLRTTDGIERQSSASRLASMRLSALRRAILSSAFSGRLVPQDPNDEPALVLLERIRAEHTERSEKDATAGKQRSIKVMVKSQIGPRKSIVETLHNTPEPLTAEELFSLTGYQPETIEDFYIELKAAIVSGKVEELRTEDDQVSLRATQA